MSEFDYFRTTRNRTDGEDATGAPPAPPTPPPPLPRQPGPYPGQYPASGADVPPGHGGWAGGGPPSPGPGFPNPGFPAPGLPESPFFDGTPPGGGDGGGGDGSSHPRRRRAVALTVAAVVVACAAGWLGWGALHRSGGSGSASAASASPRASAAAAGAASPSARAGASPSGPAGAAGGAASAKKPLAGRTVVIDPGHNPTNYEHPAQINALVNDGTGRKPCDTTGTETDAGYPEADFTLDVARRVRTLLQAEGAKVVFTQDGHTPWGPCVNQRAAIGNNAHADAAISIHADGGPASGHGFHVIMPADVVGNGADTSAIVGPSHALGLDVRAAFRASTGESYATYLAGGTGMDTRSDLGGLNLSRVPKIFIECANMRNASDAAKVTSAGWRQSAARGIAEGITRFLTAKS